MADERLARSDLFHWLCEELGYDPDRVASVRVHSEQVVVIERDPAGLLHITTYEPADGCLRFVSRGPAFPRPGLDTTSSPQSPLSAGA